MKIYLNEITDQETLLDFTQEDAWVADAVARTDERADAPGAERKVSRLKPRPAEVHFSLRQVDEVVVVNGSVDTYIELLCSRCANPFRLEAHPNFSALFCKDPVMAGVGHLVRKGDTEIKGGHNQGHARHAHDYNADSAVESGQDLDITYLNEDFIDLAEVVTEQLTLQVPFQPLCDADCKGMCANCGADLNVGRCACAKMTTAKPFAALKNLKLSEPRS